MSIIYVPDPHPGRCRNYRSIGDKTVRCLDYEDQRHVCSFEQPPPLGEMLSTWTVSVPQPQPWVKPGDTEEQRSE